MNTSIARALLASTSVVNPRVLQEKLGCEGYSEALRLGWLVPELELGGVVSVSTRGDHRRAMESAAALTDAEKVQLAEAAPAPASASRGFYGESVVSATLVMKEATDAGVVDNDKEAEIGDQVTVAEGGQSYSARVQAKNPDGTMKLSFGGTKPNRDVFKTAEIRVTSRAMPAGVKPATSAPTAPTPAAV